MSTKELDSLILPAPLSQEERSNHPSSQHRVILSVYMRLGSKQGGPVFFLHCQMPRTYSTLFLEQNNKCINIDGINLLNSPAPLLAHHI